MADIRSRALNVLRIAENLRMEPPMPALFAGHCAFELGHGKVNAQALPVLIFFRKRK
jgi:hypothetical protein